MQTSARGSERAEHEGTSRATALDYTAPLDPYVGAPEAFPAAAYAPEGRAPAERAAAEPRRRRSPRREASGESYRGAAQEASVAHGPSHAVRRGDGGGGGGSGAHGGLLAALESSMLGSQAVAGVRGRGADIAKARAALDGVAFVVQRLRDAERERDAFAAQAWRFAGRRAAHRFFRGLRTSPDCECLS